MAKCKALTGSAEKGLMTFTVSVQTNYLIITHIKCYEKLENEHARQ